MAAHVTRLSGAITAVRQSVAAACGLELDDVHPDDDLISDLCLDSLERESLSLILDELFNVVIPEELWRTPLYRTPAALAEWLIGKSEQLAWEERQQCARRA